MKTTKIMGAILAAVLALALFTGAGVAVAYIAPVGGSVDALETIILTDGSGNTLNTILAGRITAEVVGTYVGTYSGVSGDTYQIFYPKTTLGVYLNGTGTSVDDKKVIVGQNLDFVVASNVVGQPAAADLYGYTLKFTNPAGGKTNTIGNFISGTYSNTDIVPVDLTGTELGTWVVAAEMTGMSKYAPSTYTRSNTISFIVCPPPAESISISKEQMIRGESMLLTVTGTPYSVIPVTINQLGFLDLPGQSGISEQIYDATAGYLTGFTATLDSSGTRTLLFDSNTSSAITAYTFSATFPGTLVTKKAKVSVERGVVTVETSQDSYYIGKEITLNGVNTESDQVYVFIKGANVASTYLFTVDVESDDTWTTTFGPWDYLCLDAGTYTIYAASDVDVVAGVINIFDSDFTYASVFVTLKLPFLSVFAESSVVAKDDKIKISGTAEGTDDLCYYVFGTNKFASSTISVNDDGSYSIEIATDTYSAGQYFVVIQHPMYDRLFNIGPVAAESGGYDIKMNENGDYTSEDALLQFNTLDRQSANAAEALCQAMDSQNIDDIYVKLTVIVAQPCLTMNYVSDIVKGQPLKISGTTNLKEGTVITVDVLSTAFTAVDKTTVSSASFITLTTRVVKGAGGVNTWEVTFDTTGLNVDTYTIQAIAGDLATSTIFKIGWIATTPTPTPTKPPTPIFPVEITPTLILHSLTVDPECSSSITEGTPISVNARLTIAKDGISTSDSLKLTTALRDSPLWTVDVYKGTVVNNQTSEDSLITTLSSSGFSYTISGFVLDYDQPVTLVINLTGSPHPSASGYITALKIDGPGGTYSYLYGPITLQGPTTPVSPYVDTLELQTGWNFVSVPKTLNATQNTAGSLFSSVDTDNKNILGYNTQTGTWVPIIDKTEVIQPLNGYWIYAATEKTISLTYPSTPTPPSVKTLYPGWNAIGLSGFGDTPAKTALTGTSWRTLIPWTPATRGYANAIVNGGSGAYSSDRLMTLGNGYWVYVDAQSTLVGLTA